MSQPIPVSASDWNHLFELATTIALVAMAVVLGAMIFFMVRYRERKGQPKFIPDFSFKKSRARDSVIFASISIIILVSLVAASYRLTPNARFEPSVSKSLVIDVTAYQWAFRFGYPDGVTTIDNLTLPGNTTVMFNVTSTDVMHNFYLVQYKVSIEAVPGRYNILWITTPLANGNDQYSYNIYCKELCGIGHTYMHATMTVVSQSVYDQWLASQTAATQSSNSGG
jgi:cytochrome c oxidase subunit II